MEIIVNPKHLDNGQNVIQLETAVGAAMKCFDGCLGKQITKYPCFKLNLYCILHELLHNMYFVAGKLLLCVFFL